MKRYDFDLARKVIDKLHSLDVLQEASLGMHEDWFWTAETVWEDGEYKKQIPSNQYTADRFDEYVEKRKSGMSILSDECRGYDDIMIAGLVESHWATPVLSCELKNGSTETFNCFVGESEGDVLSRIEHMMNWTSGPLSSEIRAVRDNIELKSFEE